MASCVKEWPGEKSNLQLYKQSDKFSFEERDSGKQKWTELFIPLVKEATNIPYLAGESHRSAKSKEVMRFSCTQHKVYVQIESKTTNIKENVDTEWIFNKPRLACECCELNNFLNYSFLFI